MAQQWQIESAKGRCVVTGQEFVEGDEFYTALFEEGEGFRRADYSVESWQSQPDGVFCYFKTRVPTKEKKKKVFVGDAMIEGFFVRLADETEPIRVQFRFVLALILMRKRRLRYDGSSTEEGVERWSMTLMSDKSTHAVVNPRLTDEQIDGVGRQLSAILHSDMGDWSADDADDSTDSTDSTAGSGGASENRAGEGGAQNDADADGKDLEANVQAGEATQ